MEVLESSVPWPEDLQTDFRNLRHLHACYGTGVNMHELCENVVRYRNLTCVDFFMDVVKPPRWERKYVRRLVNGLPVLVALCVPLGKEEEKDGKLKFESETLRVIGLHECGLSFKDEEVRELESKGVVVCTGKEFEQYAKVYWNLRIPSGTLEALTER